MSLRWEETVSGFSFLKNRENTENIVLTTSCISGNFSWILLRALSRLFRGTMKNYLCITGNFTKPKISRTTVYRECFPYD
jgi:hypothetical protein